MLFASRIIDALLARNKHNAGMIRKTASILLGASIFIVLAPGLLLWTLHALEKTLALPQWKPAPLFSLGCIGAGLALMLWTTITQWRVGKGTPAQITPTKKLVVSGPYRYTRNPIQLGAMLYYLGLGTQLYSLVTGVMLMAIATLIASLWHKCIEEKELELRFGHDYRAYRAATPFLFPNLPGPVRRNMKREKKGVKDTPL